MPNTKREIQHDRDAVAGRRSGMTEANIKRRYPIGAELIGEGRTHFRVWAPKAKRLDVVLESSPENEAERTFHPLEAEDGGYFSGSIAADAGAFYRFRVNEAETFHPDPASRFQPQGVASLVLRRRSRRGSAGAIRNGKASKCRARSFTKCMSAPLHAKAPGEPRQRNWPSWPGSASP